MEETNLYDLPKDMLIKLITTLQDPKNLDDEKLFKSSKLYLNEMEKRKTIKIKEKLLLSKDIKNYVDIIANIQVIKLRPSKGFAQSLMEICFNNNVKIIMNFSENEMCSTIAHDYKLLCYLIGVNSVNWVNYQLDEYEIYVNFIKNIMYYNFMNLTYYLHPLHPHDSSDINFYNL